MVVSDLRFDRLGLPCDVQRDAGQRAERADVAHLAGQVLGQRFTAQGNLMRAEQVCRETLELIEATPRGGECGGAGDLRGRLARIRRKLGGAWGLATED